MTVAIDETTPLTVADVETTPLTVAIDEVTQSILPRTGRVIFPSPNSPPKTPPLNPFLLFGLPSLSARPRSAFASLLAWHIRDQAKIRLGYFIRGGIFRGRKKLRSIHLAHQA
jgi:hypothetical protein